LGETIEVMVVSRKQASQFTWTRGTRNLRCRYQLWYS